MTKVYIANLAGHDYSKAKRYGHFTFLTEGSINPTNTDRILYDLSKQLADSEREDFILLSGHQIICSIAALVMLTMHGQVNFLIFDAVKQDYVSRSITHSQLTEVIDAIAQNTGQGR